MKLSEKILFVAFLAIAIVSVVLANKCASLDTYTGIYVAHEIYGGDAYTGIQQASADTANNIRAAAGTIADILKDIGSYFFTLVATIFGSLSICKFIKIIESAKNKKSADQAEITSLESNATKNA